MISSINCLIIALISFLPSFSFAVPLKNPNTATISVYCNDVLQKDSLSVGYESVNYIIQPYFKYEKKAVLNNRPIIWTFTSTNAYLIDLGDILGRHFRTVLLEPGDSIVIHLDDEKTSFSGNGASKFLLIADIIKAKRALNAPDNLAAHAVKSIGDFQQWNQYLDAQCSSLADLLDKNRYNLSAFAFGYLKANILAELQYRKLSRFESLVYSKDKFGLSVQQLDSIFERDIKNKWCEFLMSYTGQVEYYVYYYSFVRMAVLKKHRYNWNDSVMASVKRKIEYAELGKEIYKGHPLMVFLTTLLTNSGLKEHTLKGGYSFEIDSLLNDFYSRPDTFGYKTYVRAYEKKISGMLACRGCGTFDFQLSDRDRKVVRRSNFAGKIMILNFWNFSPASSEMNKALNEVYTNFQLDTNVVFVNVTSSKNKELVPKQKINGRYNYPPGNIYLFYNEEVASGRAFAKAFNAAFPKVFLLDENGISIFNQDIEDGKNVGLAFKFPDPRRDSGAALINTIGHQAAYLKDGPYVYLKQDSIQIDYFDYGRRTSFVRSTNFSDSLSVATDSYGVDFFIVPEPVNSYPGTYYAMPDKVFVISDIEGNFKALRELLLANGVINENLEWIFGAGHLVINGDLVDRGRQVTECLWLIYDLEKAAKRYGGMVHYILGNHEIMILKGDFRYTNRKYTKYLETVDASTSTLFLPNNLLGQWIRKKNIVESIGGVLFVHGGISNAVNELNLDLDSINAWGHNYVSLDCASQVYAVAPRFSVLSDTDTSPYWFRGYYKDTSSRVMQDVIDDTRQKYAVSNIVTGHTIVNNYASTFFGGKVINVDTHHASGKSEGILIEGHKIFRVNSKGMKSILTTLRPTESRWVSE